MCEGHQLVHDMQQLYCGSKVSSCTEDFGPDSEVLLAKYYFEAS
uniref:Uncharacterized protein n=1 Tax=Arundo donax TaxID=35708 RepID=A0A0A8YWD3_ARUDO